MNLGDIIIVWLPMPPLLLELGFILLAVALLWYSRILGELLEIIRKPPLEVLIVIAAWVLILAFVIPHYIVSAVFYPNLEANSQMFQYMNLFKSISFFGLLVSALLVLFPSAAY
ncbi:MAG TPA: hypothetical protein VKY74_07720, partial [Chloroflexia bacterium]|nr:hypothetical protein [Chloroflexia bacterium]